MLLPNARRITTAEAGELRIHSTMPSLITTGPRDGIVVLHLHGWPDDQKRQALCGFDVLPAVAQRNAARYAGGVGMGFSKAVAASLRARLDKIVVARGILPGLKIAGAMWVDPGITRRSHIVA